MPDKIKPFLLRALRRQAVNVVDVAVKLLTVAILVFVTFWKAEDVAQTLEATFNIDIPPLTVANTVEVQIMLPEGEKLQVEFNAEQMALILAAIESGN